MSTKTKRHPAIAYHIWKAEYDEGGYWHITATAYTDGEKRSHAVTETVARAPRKGTRRICERLSKQAIAELSEILYAEEAQPAQGKED